ncbi:Restriction modification system DNA specificity domain protein [Acidithiobacillus ferrivorans]|uniref:Restriction modification system DNA specificity domain protein n=1 Tax=Acidithiobacillus ferrivorans TaxID=160808 RepID=A0A060UQQ9_9PROT|nr:restriction endonuclease subunit S [Acidithiobacillus ferrivorans]CDQ10780.1 Restriction modification system DNA specificity domain protein [Acidithiobacillus ferrivorans]SMH65921.1 Restriction modification system DNA specificity domain protein [Acidithiobacillus ferrivorans]
MNPKAPSTVLTAETKPARVPKLRFPEFRGAEGWKSIPLSRLAIRAKQKNRDEKIGRVLTNSAEFGVVDQRDFFDKDIATQGKLEGYFVVELGSYVYNPRISSTAPVGPISKNKIGTGVMSPLYTVFKFKDDRNDFYEHFFKTTGWHTYMRQASSTGARHDRMAISSDDFMALPLPVPSPDEQQKIAECLSSVDELMAAQARKVDALKTHKKGLMQQLFPREGETQPRLRFPEFQNAGEWEETRLGRLGELVSGLTYSPDDVRDSGLLVLRSSNVQNGAIALDDCVYVDPSIKGANLSQPNDILICVRNGSKALIGKCALIPNGMPLCTHGAFMTVFRAKTPSFVFQLFQTDGYQKQVAGDLGATINSINGGQLLKYGFFVPKPPEQQRIASCLSSLDALITAETQKLEALKTHKKGLMQQLFPSPEELEV